MTRREREQVVELLRCVYDGAYGKYTADTIIGHGPKIARLAIRAIKATRGAFAPTASSTMTLRDACLEAAARVEEGSWP